MEEKKKNNDGCLKLIAIILGVLLLAWMFAPNEESTDDKKELKMDVGSKEWIDNMRSVLKSDSVTLSNFDYSLEGKDIPSMRNIILSIKAYNSDILNDTIGDFLYNDKELSSTYQYLKDKSDEIWTKSSPSFRKQFAEVLRSRLWEENIDVKVSGKKNENLWFTGGIFASNKKIKEFQEQINSEINLFGFKQVYYKWIKSDEDYTRYDVNENTFFY